MKLFTIREVKSRTRITGEVESRTEKTKKKKDVKSATK